MFKLPVTTHTIYLVHLLYCTVTVEIATVTNVHFAVTGLLLSAANLMPLNLFLLGCTWVVDCHVTSISLLNAVCFPACKPVPAEMLPVSLPVNLFLL